MCLKIIREILLNEYYKRNNISKMRVVQWVLASHQYGLGYSWTQHDISVKFFVGSHAWFKGFSLFSQFNSLFENHTQIVMQSWHRKTLSQVHKNFFMFCRGIIIHLGILLTVNIGPYYMLNQQIMCSHLTFHECSFLDSIKFQSL